MEVIIPVLVIPVMIILMVLRALEVAMAVGEENSIVMLTWRPAISVAVVAIRGRNVLEGMDATTEDAGIVGRRAIDMATLNARCASNLV